MNTKIMRKIPLCILLPIAVVIMYLPGCSSQEYNPDDMVSYSKITTGGSGGGGDTGQQNGTDTGTTTTGGGTTTTDTGSTSTDTGTTVTDTGSTSTDTGTTVTDAGSTSTDTGTTVTDAGSTSTGSGTTVTDTGSTSTDTGTTVADSGTTVSDTGTTGTDLSGTSSGTGSTDLLLGSDSGLLVTGTDSGTSGTADMSSTPPSWGDADLQSGITVEGAGTVTDTDPYAGSGSWGESTLVQLLDPYAPVTDPVYDEFMLWMHSIRDGIYNGYYTRDSLKRVLPLLANLESKPSAYTSVAYLRDIMMYIYYQDNYDNDSYNAYFSDLSAYLNRVHADPDLYLKQDLFTVGYKGIDYLLRAYSGNLETMLTDLRAFLPDSEFRSIITDAEAGLGKLLLRANSTISYDDPLNWDGAGAHDIGLGNAVNGTDLLLKAINNMVTSNNSLDAAGARTDLYGILRESGKLMNAGGSSTAFKNTLKQLLCNIEDYYTTGGSVYAVNADYNHALAGSPAYYVNAELRNAVKEMWPGLAKLFIRENDPAVAPDYSIMHTANGTRTRSPIEWLTRALYQLKKGGIDYSTAGNEVEPSLKRMVQYNAYGTVRSTNFPVSAFDHMLYTITMGYNFGYFTYVVGGVGYNGEPYANAPVGGNGNSYQHGAATRGILTLNDSMYSLTTGGLNTVNNYWLAGGETINVWSDTYKLVLSQRWQGNDGNGNHLGQGFYVWRSNDPFTPTANASGDNSDQPNSFYMGYDYPAQLLLGPSAIGDAGLPNGGRKAITPTSNGTTVSTLGSEQQNDFRTYFPKAADGKGVLNTGAWMFNWISRACWDGQGPYYYAPSKSGGSDPTISFAWPGKGTRTVSVYYKPNGEVYAYVYKATPNEYYYPTSATTGIGNDVADADAAANGQRFNRYRDIYKSDYYAVQRGHVHSQTSLCGFTISDPCSRAFCSPPMNSAGTGNVNGTTGTAKYELTAADGRAANQFWAYEKVQEWTNADVTTGDAGYNIIGNSSRECATQEEAIFRNYQWLTLEKKFMFVIPMCMFAKWLGNTSFGNVDAYLDSAAYCIIEANGLVGLANAKKAATNGYWNIKGDEGIACDNSAHRNAPDYGNSYRPADSRIMAFAYPFSSPAPGTTTNGTIDPNVVYGLLGGGNVLPNIVGNNIAPVQRLGFVDQAGYVASRSFTAYPTPDAVYTNRNKVLPIFAALAGVMADGTYYDSSAGGTTGYDYNYAATARHKYPLNDFLEGVMIPLSKPMFRYFSDNSGRWIPRMNTEPTINGQTAYDYFQPANQGTVPDYRPNSTLRTLTSFLAGNAANATDGILPLLADNTSLVTRLLSLLQRIGNNNAGSPYLDTANGGQNILADFSKGLEQIVTGMQVDKGEAIANGYTFSDSGRLDTALSTSRYGWMFHTGSGAVDRRAGTPISLDLKVVLDDLIGDNTRGLSLFIDNHGGTYNSPLWANYDRIMDVMAVMMGTPSSPYYILDDSTNSGSAGIIGIMNKFLSHGSLVPASATDLKALRHTLGILFARYSGGTWTSDTELRDLLTTYMPDALSVIPCDGAEPNYVRDLLLVLRAVLDWDSDLAVETDVLDFMTTDVLALGSNPSDVITNLYNLLNMQDMWDPSYTSVDYPRRPDLQTIADVLRALASEM